MAAALTLTGCDRRTPEERLTTAFQFYQQGDAASAEMEALKVVDKAPDDPMAVQASLLLAQIYASQNRLEEAQFQLESALSHVSQLEPMGKEVLRMYLASLTGQKKYDDAIKAVEKYQQEYAEDDGTSLSLRVAKADIYTNARQTTAARAVLSDLMRETTAPAEMALYRDLYTKTYLADEDSTGATHFLQDELAKVSGQEDKMSILTNVAQIEAATGNYEGSRMALQQLTTFVTDSLREQTNTLDVAARSLQLGQAYLQSGNVPGAEKTFQTLYDADLPDPEAVQAVVNNLMETQLRLGETSATEALLEGAAKKHPQGPYGEVLRRMRELIAKGEFQQLAPQDTSPLVMKYRSETTVLWPEELPSILQAASSSTTGTVTSTTGTATVTTESATTGTATAAPETTATAPSETPAAPAETPAPAPADVETTIPAEAAPSPAADAQAAPPPAGSSDAIPPADDESTTSVPTPPADIPPTTEN